MYINFVDFSSAYCGTNHVPVKTLIDVNLHLSKNTGENKAQNEYASILGSLMYVMNCTRSDIAYAVSKLS